MKTCLSCKKELVRKESEDNFYFNKRKYCNHICYWNSLKGKPSPAKGRKMTDETRKKLSIALKGRSVWNKGILATVEHRKKLSIARMGKIPWNKGIIHTKIRGNKHWNWKGGKYKSENGYIFIYSPNHPFHDRRGYIREHRLVVEEQIGRYLLSTEEVHHLGAKDDNRPNKLMAFIDDISHKLFEHNPNIVNKEKIVFDGRNLL